MAVAVIHRAELCRYEVQVSGRPAGFAEYLDVCGIRIFIGARVDPEFEGHGLGSAMLRAVLEMERAAGNRIQARCTLMRRFIERYPEYRALLVQGVFQQPPEPRRGIGNAAKFEQFEQAGLQRPRTSISAGKAKTEVKSTQSGKGSPAKVVGMGV